jgi:hypothetical protein
MVKEKMVNNKTENQLITEAINAHGVFFKKAVRDTLEQIKGVTILGEEYPVPYMEGTSIDLLISVEAGQYKFIIPIECKRGYVQGQCEYATAFHILNLTGPRRIMGKFDDQCPRIAVAL